jgi:hypothetical protein
MFMPYETVIFVNANGLAMIGQFQEYTRINGETEDRAKVVYEDRGSKFQCCIPVSRVGKVSAFFTRQLKQTKF